MIRLLKNTPIHGIPDCKVLMLSLIFVSVTSYEEKLKNDSKMHLSLGVEKLGGRSPVSDQAADGQSEEEDIGDGVDELRNVGREGVVLLAPVDRTGASLQVFPHTDFAITSEGVTVVNAQRGLSIDIFICIYKYIYI